MDCSTLKRDLLERKYKTKTVEELKVGSYLSYKHNEDVPFLNLFRFEEAFSFSLVSYLLKKLKVTPRDYVVDPFCGSGTTLFTCAVKGIPSGGADTMPLAWFVSKTLPQFLYVSPGEIRTIWEELPPHIERSEPAPLAADIPLMQSAFDPATLWQLRKIKTAVQNLDPPYNDIFLLLLLSILEECSYMVKKKRYLAKAPGKTPSHPVEAMNRKVAEVEKDVSASRGVERIMPEVFMKDTKDLPFPFAQTPTVIITSPPYADKIDYTRSYALELWFHFVDSAEQFDQLRERMVRSYLRSTPKTDEDPPHPAVGEVVDSLYPKDSEVADMIAAYFVDMKTAVEKWAALLDQEGRAAVVVDNVSYYGVCIPVDLILSDVAENAGFQVDTIMVARYRRNKMRQSILVWRKR